MSDAIRVVIADDHELFRDGVRAVLGSLDGVEVVAEAATGEAAVRAVREHAPDVVLMDVQMPEMNGVEATRRILAERPATGVIVVTMYEDDDLVFAAMRAGAKGYILKGAGQEQLMRALQAVAHGEALYNPRIAERLLRFFQSPRTDLPMNAFPELTERERDVLDLIARGLDNAAIARRLGISAKTARNHVSNVLGKLMVADRTAAAIKAREAGFGADPGDASDAGAP
jgi:DNA-binding NarL/FixJ family response regulator